MITLKKKEKKVAELVERFVDTLAECVIKSQEAMTNYLANGGPGSEELCREVDHLETEADHLRYKIRDKLYSGAYLPLIREDIYRVLHELDDVANAAESCCDFILQQRPTIPDALREPYREVMLNAFSVVEDLSKAVHAFFKPKGTIDDVRDHAKAVGKIESVVDDQEWRLTRLIFDEKDLEYAHRLHLKECLNCIVAVSDRAENAADAVELAALKSVL